MTETTTETMTLSTMLRDAGAFGGAALVLGAALLLLGLLIAARRGSRGAALAMLAASFLPLALAMVGTAIQYLAGLRELVLLNAAVTPRDMSAANARVAVVAACAGWGWLLASCGAVLALARSRAAS